MNVHREALSMAAMKAPVGTKSRPAQMPNDNRKYSKRPQ